MTLVSLAYVLGGAIYDLPQQSSAAASETHTMRIATLILPTHDNDGNDLRDIHAALQSQACDTFGGFTVDRVYGGWRDPRTSRVMHDNSVRYSFAVDDTAEDRARLESVARFYGHMAGQLSVMVTHANGDVVFLVPSESVLA